MNAYKVVDQFEDELCAFTGAPFCVTVESCSAALFLCCLLENVKNIPEVTIPRITYPSVACSIVNAGGRVGWDDSAYAKNWQEYGNYMLGGTRIVDSAKKLSRQMYRINGNLVCLSFHGKKTLPIGRGGAILTNRKEDYDWLKCARFDGRHQCALDKDVLAMAGWNMMLTAPQAARGLELMQWIKDENILPPDPYQDLSKYDFFNKANR